MNELSLHINLDEFLKHADKIKTNFKMFHVVGDIYVEFKKRTCVIKKYKSMHEEVY